MNPVSQKSLIKITTEKKWQGRYTILLLLWFGWFLSMLDRMVMNISLPFIGQDLGIDKMMQGTIISAFFLGYALLQVPGGWLADKYGPRKLLAVTVIMWSIFTGLTGLMTVLPILLIVRFLFGVGEGAFPAASWKTISLYFPAHERGRATAIQSSVNTLGPALAILGAASVIEWLGWRSVFLLLSVPGIVLGYLLYYFCHNHPQNSPAIDASEWQILSAKQSQNGSTKTYSFRSILRMPLLWQLALVWFLFDIAFWGLTTWMPSYLMDVRHLSLEKTGVWAAIPFLFGAIGTLFGGYLADTYRRYLVRFYGVMTLLSALFLGTMLTVEQISLAILCQCLAFFFMFSAFALFWGWVMAIIPSTVMGSASSIVNFGGQIAGVIAPVLIGIFIEWQAGSYSYAFLLMTGALVASACVAVWVSGTAQNCLHPD